MARNLADSDRPAAPVRSGGRAINEELEFSVVIPAYFGARTIVDCLTSIELATQGRRREIIVVESSGDETSERVKKGFPGVKLIRSETRLSAGGARNRGALEAQGKLVYFTDQDCVVPRDWIDQLGKHFADPSVGAAGGSVGIGNLSNLSGCGVYFLEFLHHFPRNGAARRDVNFLVGCNSAFQTGALKVVRFPDQTLGEDILFSNALNTHGFGVTYDPRVEVKHQNRKGWKEFFNYNRQMGRSAARYHNVLQRWWIGPFFHAPMLAYLAPAVILPSIAIDLTRSRWSYLLRFLLLLPMCLLGNLVWANAFRQEVLRMRSNGSVSDSF